MRHNIILFLQKIKDKKSVDMSLYKDPAFCRQLQKYALDRVRMSLYKILETHPSSRTSLRAQINSVDRNGFSLLDYCILAGLKNEAMLVLALGGNISTNLDSWWLAASEQLDFENLPPILEELMQVLENVDTRSSSQSPDKKTWTQYFKDLLQSTKELVKDHKIASLVLLAGVICFGIAPFTAGISAIVGSVLVSSVLLPVLAAAANDLYKGYLEKREAEAENERDFREQEMWMLRRLLDEVVRHERELHERAAKVSVATESRSEASTGSDRELDNSLRQMLSHLKNFTRRHPVEQTEQKRAWRLIRTA